MIRDINYYNLSEILCKIGIVVIAIGIVFIVLRWCQKTLINNTHKLAHAKVKFLPTKEESKIPPPPPLQFFGRSRSETIAINAFATILHAKGYDWQKIIVGYRPDFLKSPETGRCLEIDAYFPELRLGIEYNGAQHYNFPNHIHLDTIEGRKEFDKTVQRDHLKNRLARENNVRIISIPYYIDTCKLCNGEYKYKKTSDIDKWNLIKNYLERHMETIPRKD